MRYYSALEARNAANTANIKGNKLLFEEEMGIVMQMITEASKNGLYLLRLEVDSISTEIFSVCLARLRELGFDVSSEDTSDKLVISWNN